MSLQLLLEANDLVQLLHHSHHLLTHHLGLLLLEHSLARRHTKGDLSHAPLALVLDHIQELEVNFWDNALFFLFLFLFLALASTPNRCVCISEGKEHGSHCSLHTLVAITVLLHHRFSELLAQALNALCGGRHPQVLQLIIRHLATHNLQHREESVEVNQDLEGALANRSKLDFLFSITLPCACSSSNRLANVAESGNEACNPSDQLADLGDSHGCVCLHPAQLGRLDCPSWRPVANGTFPW
mmetsp:Transcript_15677/g.37437  ORF Transcript_15677/g.37437 Transcript_15677/m.37437 type:complete len:242 (+) Transcript_15677:1221-1946(+)